MLCELKHPEQVAWGNSGRLKQQGNHIVRSKPHGVDTGLGSYSRPLLVLNPKATSPRILKSPQGWVPSPSISYSSPMRAWSHRSNKENWKCNHSTQFTREIREALRWSSHELLLDTLPSHALRRSITDSGLCLFTCRKPTAIVNDGDFLWFVEMSPKIPPGLWEPHGQHIMAKFLGNVFVQCNLK